MCARCMSLYQSTSQCNRGPHASQVEQWSLFHSECHHHRFWNSCSRPTHSMSNQLIMHFKGLTNWKIRVTYRDTWCRAFISIATTGITWWSSAITSSIFRRLSYCPCGVLSPISTGLRTAIPIPVTPGAVHWNIKFWKLSIQKNQTSPVGAIW